VAINYYVIISELAPDIVSPASHEALYLLPLVAILVWIDRTVNAVVRLDYMRRDVLSWRRLRFAYGLIAAIGILVYYSRYVYPVPDALVVGFALMFSALIYGMLATARGVATTKDMTFKSHVMWFGIFLLGFIVGGFMYELGPLNSLYGTLDLLSFGVCSYGFYKMARFLVPTGKLPAGERPPTRGHWSPRRRLNDNAYYGARLHPIRDNNSRPPQGRRLR